MNEKIEEILDSRSNGQNMKSICSSTSVFRNAIIQIVRGDTIRNYRPTRASWKRYVKMSLRDGLQKQYTSFRIWSCEAFKKSA